MLLNNNEYISKHIAKKSIGMHLTLQKIFELIHIYIYIDK